VIELEGPRRVTPNEIAATFAKLLDRSVADGSCAARVLGGTLQVAGNEEPHSTHSDAGRLQRRLD